jgi:tetratricopeptide (TPR) repeat protein
MRLWKTIRKRLLGGSVEAEPGTNLGAKLNEAYILIKYKEYEKARRILLAILDSREGIKDAATRGWIVSAVAATWLFQEQFSEQIIFSSDYVSRYPDDYLGYRVRAEAFWYEDRLSDAIRDYSRAIELNATDILSRSGRGQVLAELGRSTDAIGDLDFALQLLDTVRNTDRTRLEWCRNIEAFVRRGRGVALAASGQIDDAMHEFTRSVTLTLIMLGRTTAEQGSTISRRSGYGH